MKTKARISTIKNILAISIVNNYINIIEMSRNNTVSFIMTESFIVIKPVMPMSTCIFNDKF